MALSKRLQLLWRSPSGGVLPNTPLVLLAFLDRPIPNGNNGDWISSRGLDLLRIVEARFFFF
jgi:hypothetical protein